MKKKNKNKNNLKFYTPSEIGTREIMKNKQYKQMCCILKFGMSISINEYSIWTKNNNYNYNNNQETIV